MNNTTPRSGSERFARTASLAQARQRRSTEATTSGSEHLPSLQHHHAQGSTFSEGIGRSTGSGAIVPPYPTDGDSSRRPDLITRASLERLRKERDTLREANDLLKEERSVALAERAAAVAETASAKAAELKIQQKLEDVEEHAARVEAELKQHAARVEAELKEALEKLREATTLARHKDAGEPGTSLQKSEAPAVVLPVIPAAPASVAVAISMSAPPKDGNERFCVDPCVMRNPLMGRSGGFASARAQDASDIRKLKKLLEDSDMKCEALDDELKRMREIVKQHENMGQDLRKVMAMMGRIRELGRDVVKRRLMVHIVTPVVSLESSTFQAYPSRDKLERVIREEILPQCGNLMSEWESNELTPGVNNLVDQVTLDLMEGLEKHMSKANEEVQKGKSNGPTFNIRLLKEPIETK